MTGLAPITVSVYDRADAFQECIAALLANPLACESELYVISDAPGRPQDEEKVEKVRKLAAEIVGFKKLHLVFRQRNLGGFESVAQAEAMVLGAHGKIIFLEDDVIASRSFLNFLNDGLLHLCDDKSVFSISAYCPPAACTPRWKGRVLAAPFPCPWGYATWADRRKTINPRINPYPLVTRDKQLVRFLVRNAPHLLEALRADHLNPRLGFMDVRLGVQALMQGMGTVHPAMSLTRNIGCDGQGAHMPSIAGLKHQDICHDYQVNDWKAVHDTEFLNRINRKGIANGQIHPLVCALYRFGCRDSFDPLLSAAKIVRRALARCR